MDDRIGKHSVKDLRIDAQRTTINIHVGGVEKLLLFWCFYYFSFLYHRRMRKIDLKLIVPRSSSWPDLTTMKRRRD
jgi:hypothetical protein